LLVKNLGGDKALAKKTVEGFLRATISAVPTGKQNSFAAQNPPDFLLGVARKDGESWSLANAFEKPVKTGRDGGVTARRFAEEMRATANALDAAGGDCAPIAGRLRAAVDAYVEVIDFVVRESKGGDVRAVYAGSVPYLKLAGIVHGGWQMARAALASSRRLAAGEDPDFHRAKIATARFFADHMLVTASSLAAAATEGSAGTLALTEAQF
jgi:hypothetical protein